MKLRTHLVLLVVAALLPLLIFAGVMIVLYDRQQRATVESQIVDTTRALSLAVDREVAAWISTLEGLGASEYLESGNLRQFYEHAARVLKTQQRWTTIVLFDSDARQALNLLRPFGSPLPDRPGDPEIRKTIELKRPLVSNLFFGRVADAPRIAVNVPVIRNGEVKYVLAAAFSPPFLLNLLKEQNIPADRLATIIDRNQTIIARTQNFEEFLGKPAMELRGAPKEEEEGLGRDITEDGTEVQVAFHRSELTGWSVRLAIPVSVLEAPLRRSLLIIAVGGSLLLLGGIILAVIFGRQIAKAIRRLSLSANALREGTTPLLTKSSIVEVNQVAQTIGYAAHIRNQIEDALRQQSRMLDLYFKYALNPVVFLDRDFNFIRANEAYARACQRNVSDFPGHNHFDFYPSDAKAIFEEVVKTKKLFQTFAHPFVFPDHPEWGVTYWDWFLVPILDSTGEVELLVFSLNDVTQRKRVEEALNEMNMALLNAMPGISRLDTDGRYNDVNETYARMMGYESRDMIGMDWRLTVCPDDQHKAITAYHRMLSEGKVEFEARAVRKDGSSFYKSVLMVKRVDEKGDFIGHHCFMRDITERKRAEASIQQTLEQLRALHEISMAITSTLDLRIVLSILFETLDSIFPHSVITVRLLHRETGILEPVACWNINEEEWRAHLSEPGHGPGRSWVVFETKEPLVAHNAQADPREGHSDFLRKHGLVSYVGVPLIAKGEVIGVFTLYTKEDRAFTKEEVEFLTTVAEQAAVAIQNAKLYEEGKKTREQLQEDIAERKRVEVALYESEQKYRSIFENAVEGIFQITPEGRFLAANPALVRMLSYESPEQLLVTMTDIPNQLYVEPKRQQEFHQLMEKFGLVLEFEAEVYRKDRTKIWLSVNARAVRNKSGGILYYEGTAENISDRKWARETLRSYAQRLKTLSRRLIETQENERRHIARELHDELGQALTALKINLEVLKGLVGPTLRKSHIENSIGIAERLLQQVRNLSLDLRPSMLDDLGLVSALRWYLDQQVQRAGFSSHLIAEPKEMRLSPDVETACFRIAQEALTNVARHAHASQVNMELHQSETTLRMIIRDNGVGFDIPAMRARAARGGSFGLLSMEERALLLGGQIEIESTPPGGTEIRVSLPLALSKA
ncbi:MAG: PAS domain S-box protein [Deltaproteobacteria bacterium]|nr:PAS domain S-box protein [Deltaproteobacteria bacterium]